MQTRSILSLAILTLAALSPAHAATMSASSTAPVINDADISNFGDVSGTDKWFTGTSEGARGQSITTGGATVRLKSITYQVSEGNGAAPTKTYALRVGKITGTNFSQVHSETATQNFSWTSGQYMTWTFATPVLLEPFTTYGIDVGMTSSTSSWQTGIPYINVTADEYAGGTSYTSGGNGIGNSTVSSAIASDRTFHLDIERPLDPVFSLVAPSPADNATEVYASREIVMTFSQNVTPGTGNLTIRNLTDNTDTLLPASDTRLTYDQNVVRINPAGLLNWGKSYAIRIDAGTFLGDGAAPITGITDDTTWNFATIAADPLLAAIAAIKAHVLNTTPLSLSQIAAHKTTIDNQRQRFAESTTNINAVFDLISTYDTTKGALFVSGSTVTNFDRNNVTTTSKNSVTPENYHWVVYTVMQHAMDLIYTSGNLAKYEATLTNYKFGSHTSFPGPCSPPANPLNTHTVSINGSFPATFGRFTQSWTTPARKPTGTYLAPGTIATVTVPPALVNAGYKVRVCAHSWDLSARRPVNRLERASRLFSLDATTIKVASPYGGGIYIEVPYLASAGPVSVTVTGAVRAPYFSAKSFHQTTPSEWDTEKTNPAPWADFQSEKFMIQVPRKWIYNMTGTQATQLMVDWDKAMDAINDLMGFPRNRGKETIYCQTDVILRSSVHAPGYPAVNVTSNVNSEVSPTGYAGNYLVRGPATTLTAANIEFHEQGHAYGFPKFGGESESNVNLLQPAMLNRAFGKTFDEAQNGSFGGGNSNITVDNTAVAWMTVFNFSPREVPMADAEKAYQHKGHAKYMDIARLFGWTGLDNYWKSFMQDDANNISYSANTDDLLLRLSRHVGKDIRPLFHFWGIYPSNPTALANAIAAENIPASLQIRDQLLHYKTLVPASNAAFRTFATAWRGYQPTINGAWEEREHARQWDTTALYGPGDQQRSQATNPGEIYNENSANDIRNRVQELVDLYFPNGITPSTMSFAIAPAVVDPTTVGMVATSATAAVGPMEYFFDETSGNPGGTDSAWQTSPSYQDTGLTTGLTYSYTVTARDGLGNLSNPSAPAAAATPTSAGDNLPPTPSPMTFAVAPFAVSETSISMTATTATDISNVEYFFDCTVGGGHDSGWQDSPTYIDTGLPTGVSYTYQVQARDKSSAQNPTAFSAAASATTSDVTPPAIATLDPANESPGVPGNSDLTLTFNEPIALGTGFITLKNLTDSTQAQISVTDSSQISILGPYLTINPTADLLEGKTYAIQIAATAIDDLPGNSFPGIANDTTWFFTTLDPTPPGIASLSPADDATDAPYNANLVVTFDETVTLGTGNITIKNLTDATQSNIAITDASQVSVSGAVLTINPSTDLLATKAYAIQIDTGAITDPATNPFPGINDDSTWNFTAVIPPVTFVWTQTAGNAQAWTTGTNWQGGNVPAPIAGDTVDLSTANLVAATILTLGADRTATTWKFGDATTASHDWIVSAGNSIILAGATPTINVVNRTATLNNTIDGIAGLTKTGSGTLSLANTVNTYSGGTVINGGNLTIASDLSLGATNGTFTLNPVTVNANATINIPNNFTFNRPFILNNSSSLITNVASAVVTVNGAVTGTGSIAPFNQSNAALTLANTANTFTGNIQLAAGIQQGTLIVNSIGDGGIVYLGTQASSGSNYGQANFRYGTGATDPLVLSTRQFQLGTAGGGKGVIQNDNTAESHANTITIHTHLLAPNTGARTLELAGANTGANTFAGNITNGAGTVTLQKAGAGKWVLSGTNTYTGPTVNSFNNPAGAGLFFQGIQSLPPGTTLSQTHTGGVGGHGAFRILDDSATPASRSGVNIAMTSSNTSNGLSLFVGNNGTGNGGNGAGGTTGSTLELGNLNFTQSVAGNTSQTLNLTGANSYRLQINHVNLPGLAASATTWNGTLNPTTAPLTVAGNIRQAAGNAAGVITLTLDGTASGNLVSGNITDSLDAAPKPLKLTKASSSTWTLTGTSTYTGITTLSGGVLELGGSGTLGSGNYGANITIASTSGGTLRINTTAAQTLGGILSGAGALHKNNTGTLTLNGPNTYTGTTTHSAGKLLVHGNQSTATGAINVASDATLGGTGTLGGSTTIAAGGKLEFNLSTPAAGHDKLDLAATRTLTFSGASTLTITESGGATPGLYTLVTAPGGITGNAPGTLILPANWAATVAKVGNDLVLDLTSTGITASPYETWAGSGVLFDADANNDGIDNGLAFLLGAAGPTSAVTLPVTTQSGGNLVLVFDCLPASDRGTALLNLQHSADLGLIDTWATALVPGAIGNTTVSNVDFTVTDPGAPGGPLHVVATVQASQAASGKLFSRLKGDQ